MRCILLATLGLFLRHGAAVAAPADPCARYRAGADLAAPPVASPQARAIRNFVLFSHRKLADELVLGEGVYLDSLLAALTGCPEHAQKTSWLRQVALSTPDTDAFADRIARSFEYGSSAANPAMAATAAGASATPFQQAQADGVHHEATWLALMHYRAGASGSWHSQADRPAFFLSKDGKHSPRAELLANLQSMLSSAGPAYACTFPARYEWLQARFKLALPTMATAHCPALRAWYTQFPGQHISINFAASYLENPSSMFGHTFLKVYQASNRELLSPTLNYAARTEAKDSDLAFAGKGLFGGFPGVADELPFYRRLRTYTENEGRDIWEYELTLAPAELRRVLLHLWEVRDGIFDYYFLDENCAYRTLALLDVARPELGLLKHYGNVTVPVDTLRTLQAAGMLGERTLWPAFPKLVRHHEGQLKHADVKLAAGIAAGDQAPDSVAQFDMPRQVAILQLAYEYLSVLIGRDQAARETRKSTINAILRSRMALKSASPLAPSVPSTAPETGHDGSAVSFGAYRSGTEHGVSLAWVGFQHTLADRLSGYEPHAAVTVLRPELWVGSGGAVHLERIDWLAVQSTLPGSSLFPRPAWRLRLSTERKDDDNGRHLATSLAYHSGRAWAISESVLAVMPGVSVEAGGAMPRTAGAAGVLAVLLSHQSADWSAQLELNAAKFLLGSHLHRSSARAMTSFALSTNAAIALHAQRSIAPRAPTEIGVALTLYFRPLAFMD